ncbi:MAG: hypothetical protein ACREMV_01400 [Gemmatimonadales bacterium]
MATPPDPGTPGRPSFDSYHLPLTRRRLGPGALAALALHALLVAVIFWRGAELVSGGGGAGPLGGGGGSRAPRFVNLPSYSAPVAVEVPPVAPLPVLTIVPPPEAVPVEPEPIVVSPSAVVPVAAGADDGTGPGTGGGQGAGVGPGIGAQTGPGTGGPEGYIVPADPRWSIMPPMSRPASLRGRQYTVRFWVTADGRVTRVEVAPEIVDRAYRQRFIEEMMHYKFRPAMTRDGTPIASVFSITVTL